MKKLVIALVLLLMVAGIAVAAVEILRPYQGYGESVIVRIPPGMKAPQVAGELVAKGVLARRWPFLLVYGLGRWRYHLEAGEYLFDRPLDPLDVYRKIVRGEVYLRTVVIPEGSNRFDIARILHNRLGLAPANFLRVTQDPADIRDLDPKAPSLEGYLFPDTYQFEYGASAEQVAARMVAEFREVFNRNFQQDLSRSHLSIHRVVTLASLVEKETPNAAERPIIAQVFELRLKKKMLLQCDPTVLYAVELEHRATGPITESDLHIQSPYNTYLHPGLPPGPIANPGEASIRAVFHPASTRFLYFVSNTHGGHTFARTLAEHQRNVARYRKQVAVLRRASPDAKKSRTPKHQK